MNKLNYISYLPLAPLVCQHDQNQRAISLHRDYLNLMNTGNFSAVLSRNIGSNCGVTRTDAKGLI